MPMQGVTNKQGKSFGLMPKGSPPGVAVEGESLRHSCSSLLSFLLPNKRQCLEGPAAQSLSSAKERPPRVKAGAKASSPMENEERLHGTPGSGGLPVQSLQQ